MSKVTEASLGYACKRIEEFAWVNYTRDHEEKLEATGILQESVGITDDLRLQLDAWLKRVIGTDDHGPVLLGLIIGLFIQQYWEL